MGVKINSFLFRLVSINRPKQPDFAGMVDTCPVRLIFFPVRNRECTYTGALAVTVYTCYTSRYGTVLTSLVLRIHVFPSQKTKRQNALQTNNLGGSNDSYNIIGGFCC